MIELNVMIALSTLHDPEGVFLPLVEKVKDGLRDNFAGAIIAYTKGTTSELLNVLKGLGLILVLGGLWGESKKAALEKALKTDSQRFFFCDFDKILHWLLIEKEELRSILAFSPKEDFLIFGRDKKTMATYPASWVETESISSHLVLQVLGLSMDVDAAVCLLNRKAAEVICKNSIEKSWGVCAEWPILVYKARLKIGYREAKGLTWEDPDRFGKEIKKMGGLSRWQRLNYDSLVEWDKRISSLVEKLMVIKRLV